MVLNFKRGIKDLKHSLFIFRPLDLTGVRTAVMKRLKGPDMTSRGLNHSLVCCTVSGVNHVEL
jgi:hypothetical protein